MNGRFEDYMVDHEFPVISHKVMLLNGRRTKHEEKALSSFITQGQLLFIPLMMIEVCKRRAKRLSSLVAEMGN